jgi:hypothetical protein
VVAAAAEVAVVAAAAEVAAVEGLLAAEVAAAVVAAAVVAAAAGSVASGSVPAWLALVALLARAAADPGERAACAKSLSGNIKRDCRVFGA